MHAEAYFAQSQKSVAFNTVVNPFQHAPSYRHRVDAAAESLQVVLAVVLAQVLQTPGSTKITQNVSHVIIERYWYSTILMIGGLTRGGQLNMWRTTWRGCT
jgi:hypothetical protein